MSGLGDIDWGPLLKYRAPEVECRCGAIFRRHAKGASVDGEFVVFLRNPCPVCEAATNPRRVSHDPEEWSFGGPGA